MVFHKEEERMIKVLHVIGAMDRGGAETMLMNIYRNIDHTKIQFDFLVHETRECDFDKEIKMLGGNIFSVPRYTISNYFSYKKEIRKFFEKYHNYDIVHGHICSCINIYLKEAKKYNIKTIAHSHSSNFGISLDTFFTNFISVKTKYIADYFFACSMQAGLDRYGKKVVDSDKFSVINNGIEVGKYCFNLSKRNMLRTKYNINNKIVYGHVGRFTKAKNHALLLEVFKEVHKKNKNTLLVLVGRGELEEEIRNQVKKNHLDDAVIFLGVVDNVYDILNMFDIFIFPSLYEGFGIAALEAQANDLPCLISDSFPKEVVITDKCNLLPLNNIDSWIECALSFSDSIQRRNNYDLICKKGFDICMTTIKLQDIYQDILKKDN